MLARICDICGKQETFERRGFHKFTHEWGILKNSESFDLCPECLKLIKEMAQKRNEGGEK